MDEKKSFKILILLVVGIFLVFHGTKNLWDKRDIKKDGISAIGIVIDVDEHSDSSISTIEFKAVDDKTYRFQSSTSYTVGEKLAALYKRGNPSKVFIQDFYGAWGGDFFMIMIGIV